MNGGWGGGCMCEQSAAGKSGLSSTKYWSPRGRLCQGNKTYVLYYHLCGGGGGGGG